MNAIKIIELNKAEKVLHGAIVWDTEELLKMEYEERMACLDNLGLLAKSLIGRKAIPQVRLDYFTVPGRHPGGHGKSIQEIFISNGTRGDAIFRHPNFMKFLRYFIDGPDLPKSVIVEFCKIIEDDFGTSGMIRTQIRAYVRKAMREYQLNKSRAPDEFYKLAYEIDRADLADTIRDAAKTVR